MPLANRKGHAALTAPAPLQAQKIARLGRRLNSPAHAANRSTVRKINFSLHRVAIFEANSERASTTF